MEQSSAVTSRKNNQRTLFTLAAVVLCCVGALSVPSDLIKNSIVDLTKIGEQVKVDRGGRIKKYNNSRSEEQPTQDNQPGNPIDEDELREDGDGDDANAEASADESTGPPPPPPCNSTISASNVHLATSAQTRKKYSQLFLLLPTVFDETYKSPCWSSYNDSNISTTNCLPYAYIIGAAKCGTTDLYRNLCQHDDVIPNDVTKPPGRIGELYFWHGMPSSNNSSCDTHQLAKDRIPWADANLTGYTARYPKLMQRLAKNASSRARAFTLDSSVQSAGGDFWTPRLLFEAQPTARIILRTRRPADRLQSDWTYSEIKGNPNQVIPRYIREFEACLNMTTTVQRRRPLQEYECLDAGKFNLLVKGLYIIIIEHWLRVFPSSQFLVSPLEAGAKSSIQDAVEFLDLSTFSAKLLPRANVQLGKKKKNRLWTNQTISLINKFYQPYNDRLLKFMKTTNPSQSAESIAAIQAYNS